MQTFGRYIKSLRLNKRLTLRDFCKKAGVDPSNWSKIERNILQPPKSRKMMEQIAVVLGISEDSEEYNTLVDLAVIGHMPIELLDDQSIVDNLPIFFRTVRGQKPTRNELEKLINLIREA